MQFRSKGSNARFTQQLFYDKWIDLPLTARTIDRPLFTLHDDKEGYINFRKEYVRDMDPSGFKTANRLLENYDHWQLLMKCPWFARAKEEWDKELAAKMEAEATDVLRGIMKSEDVKTSEQIAAAKVLLGKAKTIGKRDTTVKRGRPTKEEVEGELKREAQLTRDEMDDMKRIGLVAVEN